MTEQHWMEATEQPLGSWAVFIGENGPLTDKITGRLHITNRHVYFKTGLHLEPHAGLLTAGGRFDYHADVVPPFQILDEVVKIPRDRINRVSTSRHRFFLQSLHLHLDNGDEIVFRFGIHPVGRAAALLAGQP
ncbi:hypothetical protein [Desulfofustis limnaeus]|uniref:GRAM domain-containing protein n=1 Tax=Desulfofustis limnaeus TaxID=2740163 RepID=A0ABM7WAI6_9BACT|nr:hypothetical protein [Desulfofustis limnaeus]BDD87968.1 hypothetical protein DPPLL_23330 [Desulfofustis limnaeus]